MSELLEGVVWLYRGVPSESDEVEDVRSISEIRPPRPERVGEYWRQIHVAGDTRTGYTSWTTDRSLAEAAAEASVEDSGISGGVSIFRLRVASIPENRLFQGRDDDDEWLIEGTVEDVEISESETDDEEDANG